LIALLTAGLHIILGSVTEKLSVHAFTLPGPSTYWARVLCTSCTSSRRLWMQILA